METKTPSLIAGIAVMTGIWPLLSPSRFSVQADEAMQQQIVAKVREEPDSRKTGNMDVFRSLIADDALFLDAHGSAGKAEVVEHSANFHLAEYAIEAVRFVPVSPKAGVMTYQLTQQGTLHGNEFAGQVWVSALCTEREGQWVCVFSQETAAR